MPDFWAGHDYFLQAQADAAAITESLTATPASIAALTMLNYVDVGYTSPNQVTRTPGRSKGFASGRRPASYKKKGLVTHALAADIRIGSSDFIQTYCLAATPPYVAFRYGIDNTWANQLRKAVCSQIELAFMEGDAQELMASAQFAAMAREDGVAVADIAYTASQFGAVLFWHHVLNCTIGGATGGPAVTSVREKLAGLRVTLDNRIEYKGQRHDWGDNNYMSRTAYGLMVHHIGVTGSLNFHDKLAAAYFTATANATNWGNLVLSCSDAAAGGTKIFNTTITEIEPTSEAQQAVDSNGELMWTVDFVADNVSVA